jgi:hypothetical protein
LKLIRENYPDILNQMTANVIEAPPPANWILNP